MNQKEELVQEITKNCFVMLTKSGVQTKLNRDKDGNIKTYETDEIPLTVSVCQSNGSLECDLYHNDEERLIIPNTINGGWLLLNERSVTWMNSDKPIKTFKEKVITASDISLIISNSKGVFYRLNNTKRI